MKTKAGFLDLHGYRLPTEAEWEYAYRPGTVTIYHFGVTYRLTSHYAWWGGNSQSHTWPVGRRKPNDWGLFGMVGNVCEWCCERGIVVVPWMRRRRRRSYRKKAGYSVGSH